MRIFRPQSSRSGDLLFGLPQGAHLVTHLFNGMDPLNHRKPNLLSFALGFDEITVELIADMIHIHPDINKIALSVKMKITLLQ